MATPQQTKKRPGSRQFAGFYPSCEEEFETLDRPIVSLKSDRAGGYYIEPSSVMPWDEAFGPEPIHFLPGRATPTPSQSKFALDWIAKLEADETAADVAAKYSYARARFYFTDGSSVEAQYNLTTERGQTAWRNDTSRHDFVVLETN